MDGDVTANSACVSPSSLPHMEVRENIEIAESLGRDGFNCTFDQQFNSICTPCRVGTYGDTVEGGCFPCPRGKYNIHLPGIINVQDISYSSQKMLQFWLMRNRFV